MSDYYDPYVGFGGDDRRWLKSQFHMHNSRVVDGRHVEDIEGMDAVFQEYKDCDYQIVAAATHNDYVETSHLDERIGIRSFGNEEYVDYDGILLVGISRAHRGEPQDVIDACVAEGGFAVICHPNQNPMLNEVSDMIPTLLTKEMSRSLTGAVGVGRGHTHAENASARGVIDYWKDKDGDSWAVKGWVDSTRLAVMFVYGPGDYPYLTAQQLFLDGFRLE